ncbi:MAG: glycosyltransferase [Agarilytica sp.]
MRKVLADLKQLSDVSFEIILTINVPEDMSFVSEFDDLPINVLTNSIAKGFGQNHNQAFRAAKGDYFAVVNPDIRAENLRLSPIIETVSQDGVGACAPEVRSSTGELEDSARHFPSLLELIGKVLLKKKRQGYTWQSEPVKVDWVGGMFIVFPRKIYSEVGGFDERYFMYYEDVDICRRLGLRKLAVMLEPRVCVIHDAQRASWKNSQHRKWHLRSVLRYFLNV